MNFFNTFRARLLIILAFLLVATLGVELYVNLSNRRENIRLRELQEQALVAGFVLGTNGITSNEYMRDLIKREGQTFLDEGVRARIKNILVVNQDWQITDSLDEEYLPTTDENGEIKYLNLNEIKNLPPLANGRRLGEDLQKFPNANATEDDATNSEKRAAMPGGVAEKSANAPESIEADGEMYPIPIETSEGRWYVLVTLETDKGKIFQKATQPLIYTLLILLFSGAITFFLVWRFTRPIANLSEAAQRVAAGYLTVRVADARRTDEIGQLAAQFNEMTAELQKTRHLEAQLQQAEKSAVVGRLASAIAHEIRNPLNYINLTLDHLRAKFAPEENGRREDFEKLTAQLKKEVGRINNQITDFLRYSRPVKLDLQPLEIRRVLEDSLLIVEPQAEDQNILISLIEREDVPRILGDAETLRSVFSNFFINAVQAMGNGGKLNVTVSPDVESVKIEIADTGGGIPAENLDKIFEPYFSTKETGTGLGLAIVKKIVDDHSGTIEVESQINEGTKFTVRLPNEKN